VARRRYFEASISRVSGKAHFDDGWYDVESDGARLWRWMKARGTIAFSPMRGNARLKLDFKVPIDSLPSPPTVEIALNGAPLATIVCTKPEYSLTWTVPARADAPNVLVLTTTATANPKKLGTADDSRDLGLLLNSYSWSPAK
ncbi:MAG TPA: hypothetical protein VN181_07675, partial [Thermoanaerobaculia bacterium]|nr:hypothetical protein [Thermoanaerobaculia bacterium]